MLAKDSKFEFPIDTRPFGLFSLVLDKFWYIKGIPASVFHICQNTGHKKSAEAECKQKIAELSNLVRLAIGSAKILWFLSFLFKGQIISRIPFRPAYLIH